MNQILSVPWHNVIHYSHIVMFFGRCFDQLRPWGPEVRFKTDPEYAHHVFRRFALEYFGDSQALAQLFTAYKDCMCNIYRARCLDVETTYTPTRSKMRTFNFDAARIFQLRFNHVCQYSFLNCFSEFNNSMPILRTSDFIHYLNATKRIFLEQLAFLSSHQNVNQECYGPELTAFKERQVFVTLLLLQRQSNFFALPHWCLILSTTMYGWGTRNMVGHVRSFIKTTVSRSYRDRFYNSLTSSIVKTVIRLLSKQICGLMVLDNFQHGDQLREQCGGRSRKFIIGTTEAAHRVFPFLDSWWDHCKIEMSYSKEQVIPSPLGMRLYETLDLTSPSL